MINTESPKLSVLLSGIRPRRWLKLYESIEASCHSSWELIIVSPYPLPKELADKNNIKYFKDMGAPLRCYQRALVESSGEYVVVAADDGVFLPNALDMALKTLEMAPRSVIVGKYNEGAVNPKMDEIEYYYFKKHDASDMPFIPDDCLMLMEGVVPRELMVEVGGWAADTFECYPMGALDLSVRLHWKGVKFIFQKEMLFTCDHMPGLEGDHAPVHNGQILNDQPVFNKIYSDEKCKDRVVIDIDNWKLSPEVWERRFGAK